MKTSINNNNNNRIIAKGVLVSNDTRKTGLNNNDLIIGPSGAGKTGGYVIPNMLMGNSSMIVADTKCCLYNNYKSRLENMGYKCRVLDFVNPKNSDGYNPLKYIRKDENGKYSDMDINTLCCSIVPIETKKDPFWEYSARTVLEAIVAFVLEAIDEDEHNMKSVFDVYEMMADSFVPPSLGKKGNIPFFEDWAMTHPNSYATKKYKLFKNVLGVDKTWGCILQFLSEALDVFSAEDVCAMLTNKNEIDIGNIGCEKTVLFLNLSDSDRSMDKLVGLFYTQALQTLIGVADSNPDSRLTVPVRIILDDFATNTKIGDFDKIISVIRSRDIYVSVILQSLSQLDTLYSNAESKTIVNNCDNILYLGGSDLQTSEYIAERVCKTPDAVLCMPLDKAYWLCRGQKGRLVDKYPPYSVDRKVVFNETEKEYTTGNDGTEFQ